MEIGMMFGMKKKVKKELKGPSPPKRQDPGVQAAIAQAIQSERRRRGRASTILTGPQGVVKDPLIGRKTLLGE
jgi:hypothetical protein